jgi:hypothetical protein
MIFSSPKNCYDEMWQLNFLSDATKPVWIGPVVFKISTFKLKASIYFFGRLYMQVQGVEAEDFFQFFCWVHGRQGLEMESTCTFRLNDP